MSDRIVQLLIEPEAQSGSWNMATDELLLQRAIETGECAVRIYSWETATVSLGYFQKAEEIHASGRFKNLPTVRRLSGGGAILHHHEVTYSLVIPPARSEAREPTALYEVVHGAILEVLAQSGVQAALRGEDRKMDNEPFLCFVRGDRNDIVLNGQKVVGSAQRRRRGAVLQHGSLILKASPHAEELPGVNDLASVALVGSELASDLGPAIAGRLGRIERIEEWPCEAIDRIRFLEDERYSSVE